VEEGRGRRRGRRRGGGGITAAAAASISRSRHNKNWPEKSSNQLCCHLCSSCRKGAVYKCTRCDVGLCMVPCIVEYHTKVNL
jgi:hypothetical protein